MSGQQERIPTGEWRKVYSICYASIKVGLGLRKLNITLLPRTPDCDGEIIKDTLDKTGLQRDVVGLNELTIYIMLTLYLSCDERGVIISHIITWNVERTRIMGDYIS